MLVAVAVSVAVEAKDAWVVDDLPVDHGQHRPDLLQIFARHREVVAVEDHQIPELAVLDAADLAFLAQEPAVAAGVEAEHLFPRDLLAGIDLDLARVEAGGGEVHVQPRVHRRDLHAVGAHPRVDAVGPVAAVDDHAERRPGVRRDRARRQGAGEILPAGERQVAANRLQAVDPLLRDAGHVRDHPAPVAASKPMISCSKSAGALAGVWRRPSEWTSARQWAWATFSAAAWNGLAA